MNRPKAAFRFFTVALLLASALCSAADRPKTHVIEQYGVHLEYADGIAEADVIYALGQAVYARTVVPRFLHRPAPRVLKVDLTKATGIPFTGDDRVISVPFGRLKTRKPGTDPLTLVHETTHVVATGPKGEDRLLTEGLAVYVQAAIGPMAYPNFGVDLHLATVDLQTKAGKTIPIRDSEKVREESDHGDDRTLAYMQEGSFVRWLVETDGLDKFFKLQNGGDPAKVYGRDWSQLEAGWRAVLETAAAGKQAESKP